MRLNLVFLSFDVPQLVLLAFDDDLILLSTRGLESFALESLHSLKILDLFRKFVVLQSCLFKLAT